MGLAGGGPGAFIGPVHRMAAELDGRIEMVAGAFSSSPEKSRAAGLSLHWLGGLPVHDATSNFRLYSKRLLNQVTIESTGGFELGIELTVKAHHFSTSAAEKIAAKGGSTELVPGRKKPVRNKMKPRKPKGT